mmetsp:Transcript_3676/g.5406  ORF Transcript_3676/g.5406 Transcript_3676/m.5406 type:complete len:107 (-) Transcript_3676:555-875(-)
MGKARESVIEYLISITDGSVGDQTSNVALLQSEELNITSNRFPWSNRFHDENLDIELMNESDPYTGTRCRLIRTVRWEDLRQVSLKAVMTWLKDCKAHTKRKDSIK